MSKPRSTPPSTTSKKHPSAVDNRLIFILCATLSLAFWWPTRDLPYHWDSAAFIIRAADFLYQNNFSPLLAPFSEFSHPPLLPALIALVWQAFGQIHLLTHALMLPFHILLLFGAYHIGKKVGTQLTGIGTLLLTLLTPPILAELGMVYIDLPASALALWSIIFFQDKKYRSSAILLTFATLFKATILMLVVPFFLITLLSNSNLLLKFKHLKSKIFPITYYLIPITFYSLWLLYHHSQVGWWFTTPGRPTVIPTNLQELKTSFQFVFYVFFIRQSRWLLLLPIGLSLIRYRDHLKSYFLPHTSYLIFLIFCLSIFTLTGEFIPRYAIFLFPLYYALSLSTVSKIKPKFVPLFTFITALAFATSIHPTKTPGQDFELRVNEDLSYQDHIIVGQKAAKFLELQYPQAHIYGDFPQSYQLTEPIHGYVTTPLNFQPCSQFTPDENTTQIFYLHPNHYTQIDCQTLAFSHSFEPITRIEQNGIWAYLVKITP
jgi:4-amino-4-deoxy-L-arabinose transferase-like glycosyltransferase